MGGVLICMKTIMLGHGPITSDWCFVPGILSTGIFCVKKDTLSSAAGEKGKTIGCKFIINLFFVYISIFSMSYQYWWIYFIGKTFTFNIFHSFLVMTTAICDEKQHFKDDHQSF